MKLDVVLLYPPISPGIKPRYTLPPLGILYLGSFLTANAFRVKIIDAEKDGLSIDRTVEKILSYCPDIVGISILSIAYATTLEIIRSIKCLNSNIKIVLGGPHISATKSETFQITNDADYLIYGEGEHSLLELVRNIKENKPLHEVCGLIIKDHKNNVLVNSPRAVIDDLDSLPFPDLELIDNFKPSKYNALYANTRHVGVMMASRGCPYSCSFCAAHLVHGKIARFRTVENVIDEMKQHNKKYKTKFFVMKDSTFTLRKKWAIRFCEKIIKSGLRIGWSCNTRVDKVDGNLLRLMKSAGCEIISYGVESGSHRILKNLQKDITIPIIRQTFEITKRLGINTTAAFMIGNPGEDKSTIRETIELAKDIDPYLVKFYIATGLPGTKLYKNAIQYGLLNNPRWYVRSSRKQEIIGDKYGTLSFPDIDMSAKLKECYRAFNFRRKFLGGIVKRVWKNPYFIQHIVKSGIPFLSICYKK